MNRQALIWTVSALLVMAVGAGCAATPAEHEYVTDYRVVGDKTVKYIYLPGEVSRGGNSYLDQALAIEICSVDRDVIDDLDDDEQDGEQPERGQAAVETDCEITRILKTEEYR